MQPPKRQPGLSLGTCIIIIIIIIIIIMHHHHQPGLSHA
jgi:hypothetical protein